MSEEQNRLEPLEDLVDCMRYGKFCKIGLDRTGRKVNYCTYHFPEEKDCLNCRYKGELVEVKLNRSGWFSYVEKYECIR
jgi:hypothetical protein